MHNLFFVLSSVKYVAEYEESMILKKESITAVSEYFMAEVCV